MRKVREALGVLLLSSRCCEIMLREPLYIKHLHYLLPSLLEKRFAILSVLAFCQSLHVWLVELWDCR